MPFRISASAEELLLAIAAWSLSPLLIYESRGIADAPILAMYAVTLGSAIAWLALWLSGRLTFRKVLGRHDPKRWLGEAALVGMAAFVVYPLLYFSAIQGGPPAAVNLVNYLWPVVAVVVVSIWRPGSRSLETALAAGFGFAGAGLAIAAGIGVHGSSDQVEVYPFLLAALGALAYGGTSGAISIRHPVARTDSFSIFVVALLLGGIVATLILASLAIFQSSLIVPHLGGHNVWALLAYSLLLPLAHISWMSAVRNPKTPTFSAAFLIPVISTGILTLAVTGVAKPEVLSALVLVLCGITFSTAREKGLPVGYAVSLAFLASIQVSQVLANVVSKQLNNQIFSIAELMAAIVAVFAGFVLSNAIQRNGSLQESCARFYARAARLTSSEPNEVDIRGELDHLDDLVINDREAESGGDPRLLDQWAEVELAVGDGVSDYEWMVLLGGAAGLLVALHAYAIDSTSAPIIVLRAFAVALIVGILFAIRDYDRHRPRRLCTLLATLRRRYGIPVEPNSPLAIGVSYWTEEAPYPVRVGLAALIVVAIGAISLNA
jgi:drug/metabolite transporter (DMT)-like permease